MSDGSFLSKCGCLVSFLLNLGGSGCKCISAAAAGRGVLVHVSLVCTEPVSSAHLNLSLGAYVPVRREAI